MSKINRIRHIIEDNDGSLLPNEYDKALLGIYHSETGMLPVYSYLTLVETHMYAQQSTEEQAVMFVEDTVFPDSNLIVVDDTGV